MDSDSIAAVTVPLCLFGLPIIGWIAVRAMQHRERIEMIRHGMPPPPPKNNRGWAAPPSQAYAATQGPGSYDDAQAALRKGIVVVAVGVALTIGLGFIGTLVDPPHYTYGPWLLGGLIPLFVGLAQVVIALISGATLGVPQRGPYAQYHGQPGPGGPQGTAPPPPDFEGTYTYRPGAAPELQRPGQPPDRR